MRILPSLVGFSVLSLSVSFAPSPNDHDYSIFLYKLTPSILLDLVLCEKSEATVLFCGFQDVVVFIKETLSCEKTINCLFSGVYNEYKSALFFSGITSTCYL